MCAPASLYTGQLAYLISDSVGMLAGHRALVDSRNAFKPHTLMSVSA